MSEIQALNSEISALYEERRNEERNGNHLIVERISKQIAVAEIALAGMKFAKKEIGFSEFKRIVRENS